jgi:histone-binding protein RBBP4
VEWSPHYEHIFVSASDDSEMLVWDLSKIGDESTQNDKIGGPSELIFRHKGHRGS